MVNNSIVWIRIMYTMVMVGGCVGMRMDRSKNQILTCSIQNFEFKKFIFNFASWTYQGDLIWLISLKTKKTSNSLLGTCWVIDQARLWHDSLTRIYKTWSLAMEARHASFRRSGVQQAIFLKEMMKSNKDKERK